jgi:Holliday junction resolvasome RuvABC endonuclease subunit
MIKQKNQRILAIDPGTRQMGIAVLEDRELIYHGVETLTSHGTPHERLLEGRRILLRLLDDFKPGIVAVEAAFFSNNRNTALLNVLVDELRALATRRGLSVHGFAPSTIKRHMCGNGWAVKADVAKAVVVKYPKLRVYLTQDRKWKERYHGNMFDAVAVGIVSQDQLAAKTHEKTRRPSQEKPAAQASSLIRPSNADKN